MLSPMDRDVANNKYLNDLIEEHHNLTSIRCATALRELNNLLAKRGGDDAELTKKLQGYKTELEALDRRFERPKIVDMLKHTILENMQKIKPQTIITEINESIARIHAYLANTSTEDLSLLDVVKDMRLALWNASLVVALQETNSTNDPTTMNNLYACQYIVRTLGEILRIILIPTPSDDDTTDDEKSADDITVVNSADDEKPADDENPADDEEEEDMVFDLFD